MLTRPIYLHIRICRKFALKQKHKLISFVLYVMQNNSDVFRAHRCWYVVQFLKSTTCAYLLCARHCHSYQSCTMTTLFY